MFAGLVGMGVQVFAMTAVMLIMIIIFFESQALRPYTFVISGVLLAIMGWTNGYTTARLLRFFGASEWLGSACLSSLSFPFWLISTLSVVDVIEWDVDSSAQIPYTAALGMVAGFLLLTVPISIHGAYRGFIDKDA